MSRNLKLPKQFDKLLEGDHRALVDSTLSTFEPILIDNKLTFFDEYTDHGIQHIEDVLYTAANLITEESYKYLNSADISVLILAVLLHDIGMHIGTSGMQGLLNGDFDQAKVDALDNSTWSGLWHDFFHEAKRFNDEQLVDIFGTTVVAFEEPRLDNLDDYSRKLYGEFLRRYHHRLAHEIALEGFPANSDSPNLYLYHGQLDNEILNIAGLTARSHGMNLRDTFDYLTDSYHDSWKTPYDIKVVFLMVVLRISDYIQIQKERAAGVLVKTKRFSSPLSEQEWQKHNAIKHINIKHDDPERIFVLAKPANSQVFLELEKLFSDIQSEFDISWAVLGETYGRNNDLKNLKIRFRRLTSSLDNKKRFSKEVNYVPEKIRFNADPELLKLLIGPLYGDDAKYGTRELMQNSVDAIKEREYLEPDFEGSIKVSLLQDTDLQDHYVLTISDTGIGMRQNTIIDYFFTAGASFRKSMTWKKNFIEDSQSQVEKTGRFGVGVLAAFLLGDKFQLSTRHHGDDTGYYCEASLSTRQVELTKVSCDIGTVIRIPLKQEVNEQISRTLKERKKYGKHINYYDFYNRREMNLPWFNWYVMNQPKIEYEIDSKISILFHKQTLQVSSNPNHPLKGWYKLEVDGFRSVHWTISTNRKNPLEFNPLANNRSSSLICNGFVIPEPHLIRDFPWEVPHVSIFDGNARLPISLNRSYLLNNELPFEESLIHKIYNTVIDSLLDVKFKKSGIHYVAEKTLLDLDGSIDISKFVVVIGDNYTLLEPFLMNELDISLFYQVWLNKRNKSKFLFNNPKAAYQAYLIANDPNYFYKDNMSPSRTYDSSNLSDWFGIGHSLSRNDLATFFYILNDKILYMLEKNRLGKSFKQSIKRQLFSSKWSVVKHDLRDNDDRYTKEQKEEARRRSKSILKTSQIDEQKLSTDYLYLIRESHFDVQKLRINEVFKKVWIERFGNVWTIPIEKSKRST